ncbi:hypothetical protein Syun_026624 [Stephania yunnanensis]|uniref:COP1-interacting protein 7 n=1 Tax=Stephania yunnanensis TaxID=152371 RepID=A0AAP0F2T5_9MAGN
MRTDTPLDCAIFQLSPKRSRCELFVSGDGKTEKLASGLVKPFVAHLTVAEEQVAKAVQTIKLEVERRKNEGSWFTKGTLERFVRFVSTPEVLESVSTFDAEMSQLEAARRIYLQGVDDQHSSATGIFSLLLLAAFIMRFCYELIRIGGIFGIKELLRAIDVRLLAVKQDLITACSRASAAGFTPDTVAELQHFAERFGAHRLNDACTKFLSLSQRRSDLVNPWRTGEDQALRLSCESDMSIDDPNEDVIAARTGGPHHFPDSQQHWCQSQQASQECQTSKDGPSKPSSTYSVQLAIRESSIERVQGRDSDEAIDDKDKKRDESTLESPKTIQPARRLSVQDRINMFESKQKEQTKGSGGSGGSGKVAVGKSAELRRMSSDVSSAGQGAEKAVLRRWSGASDMSVDTSFERKESGSSASTPCAVSGSLNQPAPFAIMSDDRDHVGSKDTEASLRVEARVQSGVMKDSDLNNQSVTHKHTPVEDYDCQERVAGSSVQADSKIQLNISGRSGRTVMADKTDIEAHSNPLFGRLGGISSKEAIPPQSQLKTFSGRREDEGSNDQPFFKSQSRDSSGKVEDLELNAQGASLSRFDTFSGGPEHGLKDQATSRTMIGASFGGNEHTALKDKIVPQGNFRATSGEDRNASQTQLEAPMSGMDNISRTNELSRHRKVDIVSMGDQLTDSLPFSASMSTVVGTGSDSKVSALSQPPSKHFTRKVFSDSGTKDQTAFRVHDRRSRNDLSALSLEGNGFQEEVDIRKKDVAIPVREEDYGLSGKKLQLGTSGSGLPGKKGKRPAFYKNDDPAFPQTNVAENPDVFSSVLVSPVEQVQKGRPANKGNQDLNNELLIKADELEKLFAEHKLRVPGDQYATARRSRPAEGHAEQIVNSADSKPVDVTPVQFKTPAKESIVNSIKFADLDSNSSLTFEDVQDFDSASKQNIASFSEDSRGKFYNKYMQKREAKLREEWSSKGAQKEAKMKAMQDSLERSSAEMKAKFTASADRQDTVLYSRRRAEKLKSLNSQNLKNREQPVDFLKNEKDENLSEFPEQGQYGGHGLFNETLLGDGSSRNPQSKKLLPTRSLNSSTPKTTATMIPKSSARTSNSGSARRRSQQESPLAQSVPNFSDFRKENTKPLTGTGKMTRPQLRTARSKSISDDLPIVREEKPRRSQSTRKSSANSGEPKDVLPTNSDGLVSTSFLKNGETKSFLRKGNGIGPGAGSGIAKLKASVTFEDVKTDEDMDEFANQLDDSVDTSKEEEEEDETEAVIGKASLEASMEEIDGSDTENLGMSKESGRYEGPESENGEILRSFSESGRDLVEEATATMPSMFNSSIGPVQDSPGESPASWNSRGHHPFSYAQETSDIDGFVDSPIGSPASWNSHPLTHMDADAARMRKKWGSAQIPVLVANAITHQQSRKDVTKGFKRLLKFGRKSRGTESLVDWISATTSEGDDDAEDVRDLANRSSEDLRKSRMGFSQDGFHDSELFNDQVLGVHSSIPTPPANFRLRDEHLSGSSLKVTCPGKQRSMISRNNDRRVIGLGTWHPGHHSSHYHRFEAREARESPDDYCQKMESLVTLSAVNEKPR